MPAVVSTFSRGLLAVHVVSPPSVMPQSTVTRVFGNSASACSISAGGT